MKATILFICGRCNTAMPGVFEVPDVVPSGEPTPVDCTCVRCGKELQRTFFDRAGMITAIEIDKPQLAIMAEKSDADILASAGQPISVEKGGWLVGDDCITGVTLYDKDENERGSVALIEQWHCEYIAVDGTRQTGKRATLDEAVKFLFHYGAADMAAGGFMNVDASFQMYPPKKET